MSSSPKRIQLSRERGYRKPPDAIVVARPTRWGNPWKVGESIYTQVSGMQYGDVGHYSQETAWFDLRLWEMGRTITPELAVTLYRESLTFAIAIARGRSHEEHPEDRERRLELRAALRSLAGHDLACWCPLDQPCHADVLLEMSNKLYGKAR